MMLDEKLFEKFGVEYAPNEIIFCHHEPGNEFYVIHSGKVKIVQIINNTEKIIDILEPSEIFGEMAILEDLLRTATAIAVGHVKLFRFHRDNFLTILKGNPQLAYTILMKFAKRIYEQKRALEILLLDEPQFKVMDVFNMFVEQDPHFDLQEAVTFKITAQEVASRAGMQLLDVQKVLNNLNQLGKIEMFNDRIVINSNNIRDFQRQVNTKKKTLFS